MTESVLVVNAGSSSVKLAVVDPATGDRRVTALAERLGGPDAVLHLQRGDEETTSTGTLSAADALTRLVEGLTDQERSTLTGVGHRVVHGGSRFADAVAVDDAVVEELGTLVPLAPLHMPANLRGLEVARRALPGLPHVAVFDTAFHQTMQPVAYRYAVPTSWYADHGVRRYGFHGTSHRYVSARAAEMLGRPAAELKLVTLHLGNGCSATAVDAGRSVDTTMGLTPLEGLVMGTRSGDVDPGVIGYVAEQEGVAAAEVLDALSSRSGLLGLSGLSNDMRTLCAAADEGSEPAALAVSVFCYRVAKAVGALTVALGRLDGVVFTGGIGEHSSAVRRGVLERLGVLGLHEDPVANAADGRDTGGRIDAATDAGGVAALVVPTDEELVIARDTAQLAGADVPREVPPVTRTLLVAPTGHGVGLTAVCLGLLQGLEQQGVKVGFYKPLAQPGTHGRAVDHSTALVRLSTSLRPPDPLPAGRVEQALSRNQLDTLLEEVVAAVEPVLAEHDVVIVEGLVPGSGLVYAGRTNVALANALDADVLLVGSPPASSDLPDTAAGATGPADAVRDAVDRLAETIGITARTYRAGERDRVVGAVVNRVRDTSPAAVDRIREALDRQQLALVGVVPLRPELLWPRVSDAVAGLDVEVLNAGDPDRRVKDVVVAAQAVPGILPLLREGSLVIVPGDRHEIVLSVCLAAMNGTRFAGLLLTLGLEPAPPVWELCRAATTTGLPIMLTRRNSYETATAVHDMDPEVPVDDAERARLVMDTVAEALDPAWLTSLPTADHVPRMSPPAFRRLLVTQARQGDARIVLPEGTEPRTLRAAIGCHELGIARCVLLGASAEVASLAEGLGLTLPPGLEVVDPTEVAERYVEPLVQARRRKGLTPDAARDLLADPITVGTMMLHLDEVDGMVAGAAHTTAATIRPPLQVIGTAPGVTLVSSVFFMCLPDEVVLYGDCAINPDPDAEQLAEIALQSAVSARTFGIEPRVAMISFSTGSSGPGEEVAKVSEATEAVRRRDPGLLVDGPLQYDAAAIGSVGRSKAPGSQVAGRANVFVFPDLNTGNTTYKAVQRSAEVVSIGPMLQGLAKPVNDLSRGASVEDITYTIAITAIQAAAARDARDT